MTDRRSLLALLALLLLLLLGLPPAASAGDEAGLPPGLEARVQTLATAGADEAYRLALDLEAAGKTDLAGRAYARVLEVDPGHRAARRALGYEEVEGTWLRGDELMRARGFIHYDGRWMTGEEFAAATRPEREAAEQRAGEDRVLRCLSLIATEQEERAREGRRLLALEEARFQLAPLAQALRCRPTSLRLFAAEALGRLGTPLAVPPLLKRAIEDPEASVRAAAADALRAIGEPSTVHPLGRALQSRYVDVRVRAAEALARLGDEVGAAYVVRRWEARSGDFPRAYFTTVRQISYIQDFDVEVAQTSFIADPIVGVLQEGVVQAVKVLATEQTFSTIERSAYTGALRDLSGVDLGNDVSAWRRWWDENEPQLLEARAQRFERAAAPR